jgi:hypothetical protein
VEQEGVMNTYPFYTPIWGGVWLAFALGLILVLMLAPIRRK